MGERLMLNLHKTLKVEGETCTILTRIINQAIKLLLSGYCVLKFKPQTIACCPEGIRNSENNQISFQIEPISDLSRRNPIEFAIGGYQLGAVFLMINSITFNLSNPNRAPGGVITNENKNTASSP